MPLFADNTEREGFSLSTGIVRPFLVSEGNNGLINVVDCDLLCKTPGRSSPSLPSRDALFNTTEVQTSGAGAGIKGNGVYASTQDAIHFLGIFCGEIDTICPNTQLAHIALAIQHV